MVDHPAARFRTVHQHDLLQFVMRGCKIGYTFILGYGIIQHPRLQCIGSIVLQSSRQRETGTEHLAAVKMKRLFPFRLLHDHRSFQGLKIPFHTPVRQIRNGIADSKIISSNAHHQATFPTVGSRQADHIRSRVVSPFRRFQLPIIIPQISNNQRLIAAAERNHSLRETMLRLITSPFPGTVNQSAQGMFLGRGK